MKEWNVKDLRRFYRKLLYSLPPDKSLNEVLAAKMALIKAELAIKNLNTETNDNNRTK